MPSCSDLIRGVRYWADHRHLTAKRQWCGKKLLIRSPLTHPLSTSDERGGELMIVDRLCNYLEKIDEKKLS